MTDRGSFLLRRSSSPPVRTPKPAQPTTPAADVDATITAQASAPTWDPSELLAAEALLQQRQTAETRWQSENALMPGMQRNTLNMPSAQHPYDALGVPMTEAQRNELLTGQSGTSLASAQEAVDNALRARREAALGIIGDTDTTVNLAKKTDELSNAEYKQLTPLQKAAVDFNTQLVQAVRSDRRNQSTISTTLSDEESPMSQAYKSALDATFPNEGEAPDTFAPQTVALLRQIGYSDQSGNLNDFLDLKAGVTAKDLERLNPDLELRKGTDYSDPLMQDRMDLKSGLARSTSNIQATIDQGTKLLQKLGANPMVTARQTTVGELGGVPLAPHGLGYGTGTLDQYFQQAFDMLANTGSDPQQMFAILRNERSPAERKQFMDYAASRIANAVQSSVPLGETEGTVYRDPLELAQLLGFVKGKPETEHSAPTPAPAGGETSGNSSPPPAPAPQGNAPSYG
jgi:hypothetical protein